LSASYTLSLHDALPISGGGDCGGPAGAAVPPAGSAGTAGDRFRLCDSLRPWGDGLSAGRGQHLPGGPAEHAGGSIMKQFKLPDVGEGLQEAEIVEWHVQPGASVELDQLLVSVEVAKGLVGTPWARAGVISRCFGAPGDVLHVGAPLVEFDGAGEDSGTVVGSLGQDSGHSDLAADDFIIGAAPSSRDAWAVQASAQTRQLARHMGIDLQQLEGSGAHGQVTEADVQRAAHARPGAGEPVRGVRRT